MGADEPVGYGKPPGSTRFRKGQSGNPKGRPKGSQNLTTDLKDVLSARVAVTRNGKPQKVSSQMAVLMRLLEQALKGDVRSLGLLLGLLKEMSAEEAAQAEERKLTAVEDEILSRFVADILTNAGVAAPENPDPEMGHDS